MRLGNTGGKNKGKKYLKITGNEEILPENQLKANDFKEWFGDSFQQLVKELIVKDTYDNDMMIETFEKIHKKILLGGLAIIDYKSYYHRAFFTNFMQSIINTQRENQQQEAIISDKDYTVEDAFELQEIEESVIELSNDIKEYIKREYTQLDYVIFNLFAKLGTRVLVSKLTGLSARTIGDVIAPIKQDLQQHEEFSTRRKTM